MPTDRDLLDTRAFCDQFGIHPNTALNWRKNGTGPTWAKIAGRIVYRQDDVQRWYEEQFKTPEASNA